VDAMILRRANTTGKASISCLMDLKVVRNVIVRNTKSNAQNDKAATRIAVTAGGASMVHAPPSWVES